MTTLAAVQGAVQRMFERLAEAAPIAWRHDPLFRGAAIGAGVTLTLLVLRLVGPHNPSLDAPTIHYDPATHKSWIGPREATAPPASVPLELPKIAPGQPLSAATVVPVANPDRFGTQPGKTP